MAKHRNVRFKCAACGGEFERYPNARFHYDSRGKICGRLRRVRAEADSKKKHIGEEVLKTRTETETPARTLAELAREAIQIQDACNLSGLVHGWGRAVTELRALMPRDVDTRSFNRHPINVLWASKLYDLAAGYAVEQAYRECKWLAADARGDWLAERRPESDYVSRRWHFFREEPGTPDADRKAACGRAWIEDPVGRQADLPECGDAVCRACLDGLGKAAS